LARSKWGGHLKPLCKQLAHHWIDLAFGEDEVAHHHRFVPHRLEGEPAAKREGGFEGHPVERNGEVAAGQPIAMYIARYGSRPGQDRIDNEPVRLRRIRRHGQGGKAQGWTGSLGQNGWGAGYNGEYNVLSAFVFEVAT
jgi:hypothetical protein